MLGHADYVDAFLVGLKSREARHILTILTEFLLFPTKTREFSFLFPINLGMDNFAKFKFEHDQFLVPKLVSVKK